MILLFVIFFCNQNHPFDSCPFDVLFSSCKHVFSLFSISLKKTFFFPELLHFSIFQEEQKSVLFITSISSLFFFRPSVCESMSNADRTRIHAAVSAVAAEEQQPEGWRFVPDTILPGYQWAPQWVPARTPTDTGARSAGRPWVARSQFSTAVQCRNTANMVADRWQQEHW